MDNKNSKVNRDARKRVQFCEKCSPGYDCRNCDKTFEKNKNMNLHTTSFHQCRDITSYSVDKSSDMIADIGCPHTVIGSKDEKNFIRNLSKFQQENLQMRNVDENFKFGPSGPYRCFKKLSFPIETSAKQIVAEVAIVEDIPMLLGNNIMKPLEAEIKLFSSGNGVMKLKDFEMAMKETSGGHYTVKVRDLGNLNDGPILVSGYLKCEVCDFNANSEKCLDQHIVSEHSESRFACRGCEFIARSEIELENHILDTHWNKQFTREKCDFNTRSVDDYNGHIAEKHRSMKMKKSTFKNKEVSENPKQKDISMDEVMKDLNTLINGSKSRRESKLITAVRNLVNVTQKQATARINVLSSEEKEETSMKRQEDSISSIFLSHHEEEECQDEIEIDHRVLDLFFAEDCDNTNLTEEEKKEVLKLHKYFAHRSGQKLWENLFLPAGRLKGKKRMILELLRKCEICNRHRKTPGRPKVGLPMSKDVNEVVSMDLKILKKSGKKEIGILYLHDEFSKLIRGQVINDKNKDTIIKAIENKWIIGGGIGPGQPSRGFFTDNGGEFLNEDLIDFASSMNITIKMTAASSPWSNGSCERAHATVDRIVDKIIEDDPKIGLQRAVDWACFIKNTEFNKTGFSPLQLFSGKSPAFPGLSDCSPANIEMDGNNEYLKVLRRMDNVRVEARRIDCDQRLKTALKSKINTSCQRSYLFGDSVWFKTDSSKRWKSGTVLGQDGKLVFLRYGNFIRRVTLDRIIPADQCHNIEEDDIDHNDVENSDRLLDDDFNEVEIVAEKKKEIEKLQQQNKDQADRIKELEEKTSVPDKRRSVQASSCILPKQFQSGWKG